jgi:chromosome segregation ATPase
MEQIVQELLARIEALERRCDYLEECAVHKDSYDELKEDVERNIERIEEDKVDPQQAQIDMILTDIQAIVTEIDAIKNTVAISVE